jgi:hypothetical protein
MRRCGQALQERRVFADRSGMQRTAERWRPIGTVLVEAGAIDESQLQAALAEQKLSGRRLGEILIDSGAITWNALAHAIAAQVDALDGSEPANQPAPPPPAPPAPRVTPVLEDGSRLETVEAMLRERQRAFLELVSTTETLRRAVAKLQDEVSEKDAEIARLRLQLIA